MIDREIEKEKKRLGIKDEFDAQLQDMWSKRQQGDKEEYTNFSMLHEKVWCKKSC